MSDSEHSNLGYICASIAGRMIGDGSTPFHFVDVRVRWRRQSFLAHVDARPGIVAANVLTVAEHERLPRALRVDQLRRFFERLKMPYRLIAEWALTTGMRRKELCGMTVNQVPATAHLNADEHPLMGVALTITKGDHPRTVYPPIGLIDRTHRYINEIRANPYDTCKPLKLLETAKRLRIDT